MVPTLNRFVTPRTPGTASTVAPISSLSSTLRAVPCSVTTKEQVLTLTRGDPRERLSLPKVARTRWISVASFGGALSRPAPEATPPDEAWGRG